MAAGLARPMQHEGHLQLVVGEVAVVTPVVQLEVVEFLGVVTGDQHYGVLLQALCAQIVQQRANQAVGVVHGSPVAVQLGGRVVVRAEFQEVD
ncbi:hypothetical protein G6F62_014779 [Rhizopus arrhizus]|nr:hypothetical protein G6F62_014779 [Rhizopus arrhizus]